MLYQSIFFICLKLKTSANEISNLLVKKKKKLKQNHLQNELQDLVKNYKFFWTSYNPFLVYLKGYNNIFLS